MTDFRFDDIVETKSTIGPEGKSFKSTCLSCSKQHKVTRDEFEVESLVETTYVPSSVTDEVLEYVSKMRAWNCCHEDEKPIDGLPEEVESPTKIKFK